MDKMRSEVGDATQLDVGIKDTFVLARTDKSTMYDCGCGGGSGRAQSSVADFEDALQHDTHAYRKARHAEDQASRGFLSSEYTDQQFRCGVRDLRMFTELGGRGERHAETDYARHSVQRA